ncbi:MULTISPECIES: glucosidase family protein [Phenylobacterium]|uniref:Glycogen debranching protein n=1 Tax=Phenylobacterium koreense TaxID=266125 RepID=A0ABV2EG70_9CAUL
MPEPALTPRPDGLVESRKPVLLPIMGPRLQGEVTAAGVAQLALWGEGDLGRLRFSPLEGPFVYAPNMLLAAVGGVFVAQEAPVMVICGVTYRGFSPARRCASWDRMEHPRSRIRREHGRRYVDLFWANVIIEQRGPDLVIAAGTDPGEAERAIGFSVETIIAEAHGYAAHCDRLPEADPLLRSMVIQGTHAALSSARRDERGRFDGLAAGLHYSTPARTYYRDGYWTLQLLLEVAPALVHEEIEMLASGIQPDGEAPSGVILAGPEQAQAWEELRTTVFGLDWIHTRAIDWWSDHFDSPLLFILAIADYVRVCEDDDPAERHWPLIKAIFQRYRVFTERGLPVKPRHERDWTDNVYRSGFVAYDLGLWVGALDAIATLGLRIEPGLAAEARSLAESTRAVIEATLWREDGWYADYLAPEGLAEVDPVLEDHLALDSLTLLRHDAVSEERAQQVLAAIRAKLETRHNQAQGFGDWGVMCSYPPFKHRADTRSKSAFAYRYHNGADWPWLDGLYAEERLRRGLPGWRYPMLRWWRTCLEEGWMGAVEYFSPPWGRGSLLQGWSSMPAAVALKYRDVVLRGDSD